MADDRRSHPASALIVGGNEQPPSPGDDAQHAEEVSTHPQSAGSPCRAAAADEERSVSPGKHGGKRSLMRSNLLPQRISDLGVDVGRHAEAVNAFGADFGQFLRIGNRQASQSDGVNQLNDGGVCADAESERQDGHRCEDGRASQ